MNKPANPARRRILNLGLTAIACGVAAPVWASNVVRPPSSVTHHISTQSGIRALSFHNLHTDEKLHAVYWKDGHYDRKAWAQINYLLRDHRTGQTHVMDLRLMDLLHDVQAHVQNDRPIEIISGYRSAQSNAFLRESSNGVAKNSFHMRGMAADIRLDGTPLPRLHQVALAMDRGGVGYYPDSEFVHLDVGPRDRSWG